MVRPSLQSIYTFMVIPMVNYRLMNHPPQTVSQLLSAMENSQQVIPKKWVDGQLLHFMLRLIFQVIGQVRPGSPQIAMPQ